MTDREAFEAWHDDKNMPYPNGHECPHRYWEWQAWQAALDSERAKQAEPAAFPGGPRMGSALQKLGARLADMLDDDQWNNIEPMLLDVHAEAAPPAVQSLEQRLRDALEAMGSKKAQTLTAGDLLQVVSDVDAPPAVQAEPVACSYCGMRSGHLSACQRPPADDEAVRLLREALDWIPLETPMFEAIDSYLAKVGK